MNSHSIIEAGYAYKKGLFGNGITIAVLDSGIVARNDFITPKNRILTFRDFVYGRNELYDDLNHGTHIAGILASNKRVEPDDYVGIAPLANLVVLKVLDKNGTGTRRNLMQAVNWIMNNAKQYNIRIVNISMGALEAEINEENDDIVVAVNELWDYGIVVCCAAGNGGPDSHSIVSPGTSRKVITVGAATMGENRYAGGYTKNTFSSRGPTKSCIMKPELVAPGYHIFSCSNTKNGYEYKNGTSMATPMVSGAIALLLEQEPDLTNQQVKLRLYHSCRDLGTTKQLQGWGMLNIRRLLLG